MVAANSEVGKRIVQASVPFLAAPASIHGDNALRETAILREKGSVQNVHLLNGIHRDRLSELAGGGVRDITLIND